MPLNVTLLGPVKSMPRISTVPPGFPYGGLTRTNGPRPVRLKMMPEPTAVVRFPPGVILKMVPTSFWPLLFVAP